MQVLPNGCPNSPFGITRNEEEIKLNDIQRHDFNLMLQKRYGLLQWEQGSGKTLAGIAYGYV